MVSPSSLVGDVVGLCRRRRRGSRRARRSSARRGGRLGSGRRRSPGPALLLSSPLLDGTLDSPLGLGVSSVGSGCDLSDTPGGGLLPGGERVMSSMVLWGSVRGVYGAQQRQKGGKDGKAVGEHCCSGVLV